MNIYRATIAILIYCIFISNLNAQILMVAEPDDIIGVNFKCPERSILQRFLSFDDLFLGELHGTAETPEFVKCLVDYAIAESPQQIVISLEMPSSARSPTAKFWKQEKFEDGRSSKSMFRLVMHLVEKESMAFINLHFMYRDRFFDSDSQLAKYKNNSAEIIGQELRQISSRAKVIALAGNAHSLKRLEAGMSASTDMKTEGMFVGPSFTHVLLSSKAGGEHWACFKDCGKRPLPTFDTPQAKRGALISARGLGHDYVYYLDIEKFTASEPMNH